MRVRIHRDECMRVYMSGCVCTMLKKISNTFANQPVVGWLEGLWYPQPTRVQILVLAFISEFISGFSTMRIQLGGDVPVDDVAPTVTS